MQSPRRAGGRPGAGRSKATAKQARPAALDDKLPDDCCVRVAAGHPATAALGAHVRRRDARKDHREAGGLRCSSRCSPTSETEVRPDLGPGGVRARRSLVFIVCHRGAAVPLHGLPDAVGAQADRLDPDPHRPEPRRPAGPAAADRRRASSCCSRRSSSRPTRARRCSSWRRC